MTETTQEELETWRRVPARHAVAFARQSRRRGYRADVHYTGSTARVDVVLSRPAAATRVEPDGGDGGG